MEYRILGPLEVSDDEGNAVRLAGLQERVLLASLCLSANRVVPTDKLIDVLWGEAPPATAANALQGLISKLRRKLGSSSSSQSRLGTEHAGYVLRTEPGELDAERFEKLVATSEGATPHVVSARLRDALSLWRGRVLSGLAPELALADATRLEQLRLSALEGCIEAELALGRHAELLGELRALCDEHPFSEGLRGQLMVALYRSGRQADALAAYRQIRSYLAEELGIEPSPRLQSLELAILNHAQELEAPRVGLTDPEVMTPATELAVPASVGGLHNVPPSLTSFLGRDDELDTAAMLVTEHRLVTISGPGGVGKTRLAVELARRLSDRFAAGVWMVEFSTVTDPALLPGAVAAVLNVHESSGRSMVDSLIGAFKTKELLVVLDNCEHVVAEAAALCQALLKGTDNLHLLATSRVPLEIGDEFRFPLRPLTVGSGGASVERTDSAAVALFADRARQLDPDFRLDPTSAEKVAQIVEHLDGLPLAIQLAAARLDVLGLDQLVERLADPFGVLVGGPRTAEPRQRSLRAALDWSYQLLTDEEKSVFRHVSIFPAPFTLEASEAIAGPGSADVVLSLTHSSLVDRRRQGEDGRFRYPMLETIRAAGIERLREADEWSDTVDAAIAWALTKAAAASRDLEISVTELVAGRWFDSEHANLHQALGWALEADREAALELAMALAPWWYLRGRYADGRDLLGRALAGWPDAPAELASAARVRLAHFGVDADYYVELLRVCTEAVELATPGGPSPVLVDAVLGQATALAGMDRLAEAAEKGQCGLDMAVSIGHIAGEAEASLDLGLTSLYGTDYELALTWAQRVRSVGSVHVSGRLVRRGSSLLAMALRGTGDLAAAEQVCNQGLTQSREIGHRASEAWYLNVLAAIYAETGRPEPASRSLRAAMAIAAEVGDAVRLGDCLMDAARLCLLAGRLEDAGTLWAAWRALGLSKRFNEDHYQNDMNRIRMELGAEALDVAKARGRAMTLAEAVEVATGLLIEVANGPFPAPSTPAP